MPLKRAVPIAVAVAVLVLGLCIGGFLAPYYGKSRLDPNYQYLLNGLAVLKGQVPGHTDHPGTPVQELGAVAILLKWLITDQQRPLADSVLRQPESYLTAINLVLLSLVAASIALGVGSIIKRTGRVWLGLLAPALLICSPSALEPLADAKPEPLLIALTVPVVILALPTERCGAAPGFIRAAILGLTVGAGIATKVVFAPLALFIMTLPTLSRRAVATICAMTSFAVLTIPIWRVLPVMFAWQIQVLSHQGQYAEGPPGLPPLHVLIDGAFSLLNTERLLVVGFFVFGQAAVRLSGRDACQRAWRRLFLLGLAVIGVQFLITVPRHYHYLLPSIVVIAVMTPLALDKAISGRITARACAAGAVVLLVWLGWFQSHLFAARVAEIAIEMTASRDLTNELQRRHCLQVPYYAFASPQYALQFGDDSARGAFRPVLDRMYPDFLSFNLWRDLFDSFHGVIDDDRIRKLISSSPVCLIGAFELDMLRRTKVERLLQDAGIFVYQVKGIQ
jgi:hypothetical protein